MLHDKIHAATHGLSGLLLGYMSVAVPVLVGMWRGNAPLSKLLLSPVVAVPVMLVAALASVITGPIRGGLGISRDSLLDLAIGLTQFATIGYWSGRLAARQSTSDPSHRRGAVISAEDPATDPRQTRSRGPQPTAASDPDATLTLCGLPLAREDETKHFKLIGTTGTGKSTAIRELLSAALRRGDRAIVADPDGGYLAHFYDPSRGDLILNPFDPAAAKWNLLAEIKNDYDADQLARSLIPDNGDPDQTWIEHARTFFIAVAQQAITTHITDDAEFYRLLTKASVAELKLLLAGTSAGSLLEDGNERMFRSIHATTTSAVRALNYTTRQQGTPLSVREWVRNGAARHAGGRGGVLFLPYKAGEIAALRSTISAWMRIAIFEAMDRPEGDQRLWFIIDELDALGAIDGLKDALARLRKFGGRTVIGLQSIGQVSGTYGHAAADTIVENCGNTLILRCSASERGGTSEFASKLIGNREVMHTTRSTTRRSTEWFGSHTTSEHLKIEPAIMASEIERLPDLEGYLKLASNPDWRRVKLTPIVYPTVVRNRPQSAATQVHPPATTTPGAATQAPPPATTTPGAATQAPPPATTTPTAATQVHPPTTATPLQGPAATVSSPDISPIASPASPPAPTPTKPRRTASQRPRKPRPAKSASTPQSESLAQPPPRNRESP
jgi:type IV secretory pathway TraG/TraD family ATPase VirD4